jgi:hypothetical protein
MDIRGGLEKKVRNNEKNIVLGICSELTGLAAAGLSIWAGVEAYNSFNKGHNENALTYGILSGISLTLGVWAYYNAFKFLKKK